MSKQIRKMPSTKPRRRVYRGVFHIQAGHHNTIITVTNIRGEVLCWSSAGTCGFKGKRKSTGFAAKKAAEKAKQEVDKKVQKIIDDAEAKCLKTLEEAKAKADAKAAESKK